MVNTDKDIVIDNISLEDIEQVAKQILSYANQTKVWMLDGEMGSGKTTLIKVLCKQLGSEDTVTSPTFSLVNEYVTEHGSIFHFDFYRVNNLEEAQEAGVEDYFYSGEYCFIEWPEIVAPILPDELFKIRIDVNSSGLRSYKLSFYEIN
ncbi:MAG: tRNA (adenosine(37)-N6)-threonylcarbamoyltransferase complex ATPase subunit type 1 TsaE [Bacteroidota bacterium]